MPYARKTKDEWHIETNYGYGWECECVEDSRKAGLEQVKVYRANIQGSVRMRKRRVRRASAASPVVYAGVYTISDRPELRVRYTNWLGASGYLIGTAILLLREWLKTGEELAWLVMLDRLQECPEEVAGLGASDVLAAVEWLRSSH